MSKAAGGQAAYSVFPVANYKFGSKAPREERASNAHDKLARIRAKFDVEGVRRTVDAVLLVADHSHPHVLLLQMGSSHYFKLPGGKLKPEEDEVSGLKRKLELLLTPESQLLRSPWDVGECVGTWVRPNFDTVFYPYAPPHISRPKELRKLFVVQLPENCYFGVPKNYSLVAVPLFELHDNAARYGPINAALPAMLSRLRLTCVAPLPPPAVAAAEQAGADAAAGAQQPGANGQLVLAGEGVDYGQQPGR